MQNLLKCNLVIKILLIIFSIGMIILDCLLYYIMKKTKDNNQFLFKFSTPLKLLYLYEKPIIILLFSILLIFLLFIFCVYMSNSNDKFIIYFYSK